MDDEELLNDMEELLAQTKGSMKYKKLSIFDFDAMSYTYWAVNEVLEEIYKTTEFADVTIIRNIILTHTSRYERFIRNSSTKTDMYKVALNAMDTLDRIAMEHM